MPPRIGRGAMLRLLVLDAVLLKSFLDRERAIFLR